MLLNGDVKFMPEVIYDLITTNDWKLGYIETNLDKYYNAFSKRYSDYLKEEMDFLPRNLYDDLVIRGH